MTTDEIYFECAGNVPGTHVEHWPVEVGSHVRVKSGVFDGLSGVVLENGPFNTVILQLDAVAPAQKVMVLRADLEPAIVVAPPAA